MKLMVLSDAHLYRDDGEYYSRDTFLRFVAYLNDYFETIDICSAVAKEKESKKNMFFSLASFTSNSIKIHETFPYGTVTGFYKKFPVVLISNFPVFVKTIRRSDAVFIRVPAMNAFLVAALAKVFGKPVISYFVGDDEEIVREGEKYRGYKYKIALSVARFHGLLYRWIIKISKASLFLSTDYLKRMTGGDENSFYVFPSLVEEDEIRLREAPVKLHKPVTILYVGRLSHEKGLEYLLQALTYLINDAIEFRLLLCGEGPEKKRLEEFVASKGLDNYVEILGAVPFGASLNSKYLESDIFVLASVSEMFGKVLLEAMSKGVAIVATEAGGIPDIVKNGENGILVPTKDPLAIAEAIKALIRDDDLRNRVVENGYRFVKEHTARKQAQRIADIIRI